MATRIERTPAKVVARDRPQLGISGSPDLVSARVSATCLESRSHLAEKSGRSLNRDADFGRPFTISASMLAASAPSHPSAMHAP